MTDNGVVWEDPPQTPGRGRRPLWPGRLAPLLDRPDTWGRVMEYRHPTTAYGIASRLKSGDYPIPPGRWDFTSRSVDGKGYIYARYLGPVAEAEVAS